MNLAPTLRPAAEDLAAPLPSLLAAAEQLAVTVHMGEHGRRRPGQGDDFWQYRPASDHDSARSIDWRRSARSDETFIQDKEWQIAQSVYLWLDRGASMGFASGKDHPTKGDRARVLTLALTILLIRGGERVGMTGGGLPPRGGTVQIERVASALSEGEEGDYLSPDITGLQRHARAVIVSDFLGPVEAVEAAVTTAAERGVRGVLLQVLDPEEAAFPFDGRTIFQSMGGGLTHETLKAGELRERYLSRLAERRDRLERAARLAGWQMSTHVTSEAAAAALLWLYRALERRA